MAKTLERRFRNRYDVWTEDEKIENGFYKELNTEEDLTDQSQIIGASIVEMAKRFGIDAIIAKAEQTQADQNLQDKLYGHDFTQMFKSREELLNTKKRLNNIFENIPARIRKNYFNDDVTEFINAYTSGNEQQIEQLTNIGLVSQTQFEQLKELNKQRQNEINEAQTRKAFINKLEEAKAGLYEQFKETGNININDNQNNSTDN